MIELLNWVSQDTKHFLGTIIVGMAVGTWSIEIVKAWRK